MDDWIALLMHGGYFIDGFLAIIFHFYVLLREIIIDNYVLAELFEFPTLLFNTLALANTGEVKSNEWGMKR